jgi:hypothetical protein
MPAGLDINVQSIGTIASSWPELAFQVLFYYHLPRVKNPISVITYKGQYPPFNC